MAKTILGVDIGYDNLKLALVSGGRVKKTASLPMPKNLMKDGHVTSGESMGEFIRGALKENGLRARDAAFVLPNETVFVKNVTLPQMTAEQLEYNLPFEFRDYITDEIRNYVFDYAMLTDVGDTVPTEEVDSTPGMELLAVGVARETVESAREVMRKAGLRLAKAAPAICAYISLIRSLQASGGAAEEYCIIDLGYQAIRMYMFRGERHMVTRVLEIGLSSLDDVIAEAYSVDVHLAHTYLMTNYESCQQQEMCLNAYGNIAVELMRALNFYRFSNPDSQLADVWLCGGGAVIEPLRDAIVETLGMQLHLPEELVPGGSDIKDCYTFVQAIGIAMD